jgi:hypothetical protein
MRAQAVDEHHIRQTLQHEAGNSLKLIELDGLGREPTDKEKLLK